MSEPPAPCPGCAEPRGGRYQHAGRKLCWPCFAKAAGVKPLSPRKVTRTDWMKFRDIVVDALWDRERVRWSFFGDGDAPGGDEKFRGYIDQDAFVGTCPICAYPVGVRFFGTALRMTLRCESGCSEAEVVARIRGLRIRP